jgi:hypothetical protein
MLLADRPQILQEGGSDCDRYPEFHVAPREVGAI